MQQVLERMIHRLDRKIAQLEIWHRQLSWTRLGLVLGGLVAAGLANVFFGEMASGLVVMAMVVSFVVVVKMHNRIERSLERHRMYQQIKTAHLARLRLDWEQVPVLHGLDSDADHPFENDLNLSGDHSLLQLMDTTRSRQGYERLRQALLQPTLEWDHIRSRQAVIGELMALGGFRDRLSLNSTQAESKMDQRWDGGRIQQWLDDHVPTQSLLPYVCVLGALSVVTVVTGILSAVDVGPLVWRWTLPIYLIGYFGLYALKARELGSLLRESYHLERTLKPFAAVLTQIEQHAFDRQPHVQSLCDPIQSLAVRPSLHIKRLMQIAGAGRWQQGQLLWLLLNATVPWDLFFTHLLNREKLQMKNTLPGWLQVWYDLETLCALAHFGATQTAGVFPEWADGVTFEGRGLGHPLIAAGACVTNEFSFLQPGEVVIITGSNMSGKSTFLRTLGVNLCLAYAGAPVVASFLKVGLFRLFTCIKVSDSVTDGISYFYAEVRRLKALLAEIKRDDDLPVFFLIDEIFRGTNNRERLIGSRSYIQALIQHKGLGLVSTHDLELVHLEKEFANIRNFHFRETIQDGKMAFDYRLQAGPCPTTNALTIMKLEGLPVEDVGHKK